MEFAEGQADVFLNEILPHQKHFTRNFPGCQHLELWQGADAAHVVMSYSIWDSQTALDEYRSSEKFRAFWKATKAGFATPARAWSMQLVEVVPSS